MRFAFIVMTVILTLGVGISVAKSAEKVAMNSRIDEVYAALDRGDIEDYLQYFHEGAVYAIESNVSIGRGDIAAFDRSSFANGMQIAFTHHSTRLLSPTTAITHGTK